MTPHERGKRAAADLARAQQLAIIAAAKRAELAKLPPSTFRPT